MVIILESAVDELDIIDAINRGEEAYTHQVMGTLPFVNTTLRNDYAPLNNPETDEGIYFHLGWRLIVAKGPNSLKKATEYAEHYEKNFRLIGMTEEESEFAVKKLYRYPNQPPHKDSKEKNSIELPHTFFRRIIGEAA